MPEIGFLAGWLLLGGLLGRGLGFFIPNLHPWRAALAGAGGGALGATAFILISQQGDVYGRFVGAALLGGCIGLMVALVELAFRAAWLEVHYGEREVITVNLGPEPVKIGSDARACTVWARGAAPLALRFWVREGQVVCEDAANRTKGAVADGARRRAGAVEVVVRTGSGAGSKRPAPKPAARPEPLSLDDDLLPLPLPAASCRPARATNDDDYDSLPMPVSPPPAAPPKTASRPALPAVPPKPPAPSPTGSKPALPPVPPAAPATTVRATPTNPPGQTRAMNIPCPRCKEKLPLGSRKCPACGTSW